MSATATFLVALIVVLALLRVFRGEPGWVEFVLIAVALSLALPAQFAKMKQSAARRHAVKATRDSVQKHFWELRHNREW